MLDHKLPLSSSLSPSPRTCAAVLHSFFLIKGSHQSEPLKRRPRLEGSTPASVGTALCEAIKRIKINYGAIVSSSDTQVWTFVGLHNQWRLREASQCQIMSCTNQRETTQTAQRGGFLHRGKPDAMSPKGKRRRHTASACLGKLEQH